MGLILLVKTHSEMGQNKLKYYAMISENLAYIHKCLDYMFKMYI